MQEVLKERKRANAKNILIAWLLIVLDFYFFIMLGWNILKGASFSTNLIFFIISVGILIYPAYILLIRCGIVNKILFVVFTLVLFIPFATALKIRGYGDNYFEGDIMGLVPKNMAAVIELRDLDEVENNKANKLHQIVDFTQKLGRDSIYLSSLETDQAKKFFGEDKKTLAAKNPIEQISKEFKKLKEQFDDPRLETLNSIFGKFDLEKDLLSKELLFSIRPKDGANPEEMISSEDDENSVRVAPNKYKIFNHPESTFLMLTRVSEKIKIYLNLDEYAFDYIDIPGVRIKVMSDYREIFLENENFYIYYSLYKDVLAVTTEKYLIRKYVSLCDKEGRDSTSFLKSDIYQTTKDLYAKDESMKDTDMWAQSHLRISVNMEELKKLSNIEYIMNVPDEILMTDAGEFVFRLIDELMKSLFNLKVLVGATTLVNFEDSADSGLILNVNGYGFYGDDMPGELAATYNLKPRKPALGKLMSDKIFGYFEIDKDLQQFNEYLSSQSSIYGLTPTLGEELLSSVGDFVSNKLCLFFRPQDLFKELPKDSEDADEVGAPPFTPLWAIGAELSTKGQQQNSYTLASKILANLIPGTQRGPSDEIKSQVRFPIERIGKYEIRTIFWANPETGENRIPILLSPYFGPQVNPAMTIVDNKYLVVSTSKEMLEEMIQANINNTYRLNTRESNFGDLGALEQNFSLEKANITGRLDVRDFLDNFFTKQNITNLAKAYNPEEPYPSLQKSFRDAAERRAELNGRKSDKDYIEKLYLEKVQRYMQQMADGRDNFVNNKLDSREFFKLISQFGIAVKSLNQKNGFKLKLILTLGTQTEH